MKQLFFIIVLCWYSTASSQEVPLKTQEQLEDIAERRDNEIEDDDQWLQQLDFFRKHPLNINTATKEELEAFRFLMPLQMASLISYRESLGKLISIYELQAVPGWDIYTIRKLLPFIYAGPAVTVKENFFSRFKADHSLLLRLTRVIEKSQGYILDSGNRYLGSPDHLFFRYRYQFKDLLYFGVTADKDAGEQFFRGSQSVGFDFYSVHFFAKKLGLIKALALGDFVVNLGQGLIQWQSAGFIKSSEAMAIRRQSPVLMPYRAAGEYNFYRGVGMTVQKRRWEVTGFISRKKLSGNINDSSGAFSSYRTSGYSRTTSEIDGRNRIREMTTGGSASYRIRSFEIAFNAVAHKLGTAFKKDEVPYNNFAMSGTWLFNAGIDHSYTYRNFHIFGEVAFDKNKNPAIVEGLIISADQKADLSFLYRNISKSYQSLNAQAFTENSSPVNEEGIYMGLTLRPAYGWTLNAYADLFRFPWLKYRMDAPAGGADYLLHLDYQPSKQTEVFLRWRSERKPLNEATEKNTRYPFIAERRSLRLHFGSQLSSGVLFRSRIEMVWVGRASKKEEGFLGYVETVKEFGHKIKTSIRFQYVETGSYDSRIYVYESDVLYNFSIPAYYDKGLRYYLNLNCQFTKKINCCIRMARWELKNEKVIGSGLDLIRGNKKTEVKLQWLLLI